MILLWFWIIWLVNAQFIAEVLNHVDSPNCGSIGDFHFCIGTEKLLQEVFVLTIEQDQEVQVQGCQSNPPWHLKNYKSIYSFSEKRKGQNVSVYVVDTLVDISHTEFEGRAKVGYNSVSGMHYHATHVAGIIASKTFGVAKKAEIISVAVLDANGHGSYSEILKGLAWIGTQKKKGVVNMSLGGGFSDVVNKAVEALQKLGHLVVVAAGNDYADACNYSPASAAVTTVGAFDINYRFASFSNFGKCVDILAPGVGITSTLPHEEEGVLSGTSMATPFVAGVLAAYASGTNWPSTKQASAWLTMSGVSGVVTGRPPETIDVASKQILRDASCKTIKAGWSELLFQFRR